MRRTRESVYPAWLFWACLPVMALIWLIGAPRLRADWLTPQDNTVFGEGMTYVPPSDMTGWFFNSNAPPEFPSDPMQIWTSAGNIATLNYWLSLVTSLGDNSAMLQELYGLGMITAPNAAAVAASQLLVSQILGSRIGGQGAATTQQPNGAPEPVTLWLLAGGLVLLTLYATGRRKRIRLDRPDRLF